MYTREPAYSPKQAQLWNSSYLGSNLSSTLSNCETGFWQINLFEGQFPSLWNNDIYITDFVKSMDKYVYCKSQMKIIVRIWFPIFKFLFYIIFS